MKAFKDWAVTKAVAWFYNKVVGLIDNVLGFLKSPAIAGQPQKFSHKRLIAVGAAALAVRQLIMGDKWGALGAAIVAVVETIIAAITKS